MPRSNGHRYFVRKMETKDKDLLTALINLFCIRRTKRKKLKFVKFFSTQLDNYEKTDYSTRIGVVNVRFSVFGNITNANHVLLTAYDTTEKKLPGSQPYHPLNTNMNRKNDFNNMVLNALLSIIILLIGFILFKNISKFNGFIKVLVIISSICFVILSVIVARGFTCKGNVSKTTPLFLLEYLSRNKMNDSYIISDYLSYSKLGLIAINKMCPNINNKKILYLDSLGEGSILLIGYTNSSRNEANKIKSLYNGKSKVELLPKEDSRFDLFDNIITLCFVEEDKDGYCVKNSQTNKDKTCDVTNLENLINALEKYL